MEFLKIVLASIVAAVIYGVLNDLVTAHLCIEFFKLFPLDIQSSNPIVIAVVYGVLTTWWVGLILGMVVASAARIGNTPKLGVADVMRPIGILMLIVAGVAATFGFATYLMSTDDYLSNSEMFSPIPVEKHAMGPLRHRDIETLLGKAHQITGGFAETRLRTLQRFVLGGEDGYVVAHPRLGEHLRAEVFHDGEMIERSLSGFLAWGQEVISAVNSGTLGPDRAPPYLLQFYIQHLVASENSAADFTPFARHGWMRAWEAREGGHRSFASDLNIAMLEVKRRASATDPWRTWVLEGALMLNSIRQAADIPPSLLVACVEKGVMTLRHGLQRLELVSPEHRARGLVSLLDTIPEKDRAYHLAAAQDAAHKVPDYSGRIRALCAVARKTTASLDRSEIEVNLLRALRDAGSMSYWLDAMEHIAPTMTGTHVWELLWEAFAQVSDENRWRYLDAILPFLPADMLPLAIEHALALQAELSPNTRADGKLHGKALVPFFPFLSKEQQTEQWPEVLELARSIEFGWDQTLAFVAVYPGLPDRARSVVESEMIAAARRADSTLHGRINCLAMVAKLLLPSPLGREVLDEAIGLH
jgi:hypothetical protein